MRKITSISGAIILILALCGFVYAADTGSDNDGVPFYTKDYDGPYNMNETPMTYFEPFLTVDNDTLTPLADNITSLTLFLCQGDQEWTLLKEYTGWQDVNRFGVYTDIGVGNNRTLIFSGGHSEGFSTFTSIDPSTEIGLWLHNDTNNDSIYNGDDSFLFSETTLSKGTLAQEHQWFMVYDVSAYIGMGKTFNFNCPTENFSVTGNFHYLVYIDDNHTSSNFDHNDMILGAYCANTPPEVTCPGDMDMLVCGQDQVEIAGFDIFDAEDNIETIECSVGTYADGSVFFTPTGSGDYEIVLTVTDAFGQSASCTTMVTVEMNSPPTCIVPESGVIVQCTPTEVCMPAFAEDVDGNLIGCEIISGPGQLVDGNWCYTPSGDEIVDVTMVCTDECEEFCEASFSIEFVMRPNWAVLTMDRTGSMSLTNAFGESRILRAKDLAHTEIDKLVDMNDADYPGVFEVAIYYFNSSEGVILAQDFTSDAQTLHDAVDAIPGPRHDTPLAAAMCQSHCELPELDGECNRYVITYTDGLENASTEDIICDVCVDCNQYIPTGWNYDCDPANPASCTDWQICLSDKFALSGVNLMHYFGNPINPFQKGGSAEGLEDLYFLKYTAEQSDGQLIYHSDLEEVCADANRDGKLNVSDAIYVINYIFVDDSPAPDPMAAGDANWDGGINVTDAIVILNHVFMGTPAPQCALQ